MSSWNFDRDPFLAVDLMVSQLAQQVAYPNRRQPVDGANMGHHHSQNYANQAPNLTKTTTDVRDNGFLALVLYLKAITTTKQKST